MANWNTAPGLLGNVSRGTSYVYNLLYNNSNNYTTFSIVSGQLPWGLSLSGPLNGPQYPLPSIYGMVALDCPAGNFNFTIRAQDLKGNILDRGFQLFVNDTEPSYAFPNSNLGIIPDAGFTAISVAPLTNIGNVVGNIKIISGSLPANLSLSNVTGIISGFVNPAVLYSSSPIYPNLEPGAPNLPQSANTAAYTFTVAYSANLSANYSLTVMRTDLFSTGNLYNIVGGKNYADYEVPSGVYNGTNKVFTLANSPNPSNNIQIYFNGMVLAEGTDYTVAGSTVTFTFAPSSGSIVAFYTY